MVCFSWAEPWQLPPTDCERLAHDRARAFAAYRLGGEDIAYITLRNSSWMKGAAFVPQRYLRYHSSLVLVFTRNGATTSLPNVPLHTYNAWAWADAPAEYYNDHLKPLQLSCE